MGWVIALAALGVALYGGYTDIRTGRVYNWLTYPAAATGLLLNTWANGGSGALLALAGWGAGIGLLLIPYLARLVGGGDVKLLAAVGAFLGPGAALAVLLAGAVGGGILAVGLLVKRRQLQSTLYPLLITPRWALSNLNVNKGDFPFAVNIALGTLIWLLLG